MTLQFVITIVILITGFVGLFWYLKSREKKDAEAKQDDKSLLLLQNQLTELNRTLDSKLGESTRVIQEQFTQSTRIIQGISGQSQKIISEISEKMTKLDDTNKQVVGFAGQLQSLENILKNPKQRGVLGEYFLETVLKNVLPPGQFQMQYKFKDGETVDAVVFTREGMVPIDSKFSLENYNRIVEEQDQSQRQILEKQFKQDLKLRIDETSKYIRPNEKTTDFAFMFIPSEGIYYDLLINQVGAVKVNTQDLIEYALRQKKVIIVSPTTFFAYLQTVLHGLRALKIEEGAKEIRKRVEMLGKHINAYEDYFRKLGGHLGTTVNTYNTAYKELGKIDKDVLKISEGNAGGLVSPELIDKPSVDN
ncbi:DNA recombination protein RmuC [Patescibacteria group bacterium]|nr:DNA recombination protein RmuC [Patescibacteria group bacterium]MBU4512016.1 DNA recombination protein RmuC [Patescibacteria group bacterium]MCG2693207.1 DNA recombination protein RmuC [Candidatus Parcubacteria bacterium]